MKPEFIKGYDDGLKSNTYTLRKTEKGKTAEIKVIDYDDDNKMGPDNHDGVIVSGDTSIFTVDEIKADLLKGYRNTVLDTTTKNGKEVTLPSIASSGVDGKIKFEEKKECNLGSFAKRLYVEPAKTAETDKNAASNTTAKNFTVPEFKLPNFMGLSTGMPMMDTSMFDGMGMGTQAGAGMPNFNFGQYQQQANMANTLGTLLGMLSACGGENNFASSFMMPFLMSSMMGNFGGNFFTSAPSNVEAGKTDNTAKTEKTDNADNTAKTDKTDNTAKTDKVETIDNAETDVVAQTKKEQEELAQKEKSEIIKHTDGSWVKKVTTSTQTYLYVHDKNDKLIGTDIYSDGGKTRRSENLLKGQVVESYYKNGQKIVEVWKRTSKTEIKLEKKCINGELVKSAAHAKTESVAIPSILTKNQKTFTKMEERAEAIKYAAGGMGTNEEKFVNALTKKDQNGKIVELSKEEYQQVDKLLKQDRSVKSGLASLIQGEFSADGTSTNEFDVYMTHVLKKLNEYGLSDSIKVQQKQAATTKEQVANNKKEYDEAVRTNDVKKLYALSLVGKRQ